MKCPICGTALPLSSDRCPACSYRCSRPEAPAAAIGTRAAHYEPPNKTSRTACCCCAALLIVPLLVLLIGAIIFGTNMVIDKVVTEDFGIFEDIPTQDAPVSPPSESEEHAFSIQNGEVSFLPHKWNGSPIVNVPETVNGETVTALAPGCFANCAELTTIVLPNTITKIGSGAFTGCTDLRGLLIPDGTVTVGADAFEGCTSLEALYVPESVNFIAPGCLADCDSLLYIFYDGTFEAWSELYNGFVTPFTTAICLDGAFYHGATG